MAIQILFLVCSLSFIYGYVCLRYAHIAPVSATAFLSWFGYWYDKFHNWHNLIILLTVNVFSPSLLSFGISLLS